MWEAQTLPLCHSLLIEMIVFSTWYTSVPLLGSIKSAFLLSTYEAKSILQVHWLRFFLLPCWSKMGESGKIWLVYFRYEMKCSFPLIPWELLLTGQKSFFGVLGVCVHVWARVVLCLCVWVCEWVWERESMSGFVSVRVCASMWGCTWDTHTQKWHLSFFIKKIFCFSTLINCNHRVTLFKFVISKVHLWSKHATLLKLFPIHKYFFQKVPSPNKLDRQVLVKKNCWKPELNQQHLSPETCWETSWPPPQIYKL